MGAVLGLALGLVLAAVFEIPRLLTVQNVEDAKHYTGLPVLAAVPELLTDGEIAAGRRIHFLRVAAGFAATIISIPILIVVLQLTRIIDRIS